MREKQNGRLWCGFGYFSARVAMADRFLKVLKSGFIRGFSSSAGKAKGLQIPGVRDIVAVASGKGGVGKSTTAEMAVPEVDKKLLGELEEMGFSLARATRALHYSGNSSLEDAINWIVDHENDPDIDQMPLVPVDIDLDVPKPFDVTEQVKLKAQELRCQLAVGLLDVDVYGPSIPTMMKLHGKPEATPGLEEKHKWCKPKHLP